MTIQARLKAIRNSFKWTRRQVSAKTGLHYNTVVRSEWVGCEPTYTTLQILASLYEMTMQELFEGVEIPQAIKESVKK